MCTDQPLYALDMEFPAKLVLTEDKYIEFLCNSTIVTSTTPVITLAEFVTNNMLATSIDSNGFESAVLEHTPPPSQPREEESSAGETELGRGDGNQLTDVNGRALQSCSIWVTKAFPSVWKTLEL